MEIALKVIAVVENPFSSLCDDEKNQLQESGLCEERFFLRFSWILGALLSLFSCEFPTLAHERALCEKRGFQERLNSFGNSFATGI